MPLSATNQRICADCVLPENFPGVIFDSLGICNYCRDAAKQQAPSVRVAQLQDKVDTLIDGNRGKSTYDCIVAYSGGKDSTFTLQLLVEKYGLNCLAVTIDNGFISDQAWKNCDSVTTNLGVDYVIYKPANQFMQTLYVQSARNQDVHPKSAIRRASSMCNSCINMINVYMLKLAIQHGVPIIAGGYIGGQVPKDAAVLEIFFRLDDKSREAALSRYEKFFGPMALNYMSAPIELALARGMESVTVINPMLTVLKSEDDIVNSIVPLGWERTRDTGKNSSNCRLNDLGIAIHHKQHGFNPYVFEISEQVRTGVMNRNEGIEKAFSIPEFSEVAWQAERLGLSLDEFG